MAKLFEKPLVDRYKYHDYGPEDVASDCRLCGGILVVITLLGSLVYAYMRWYV